MMTQCSLLADRSVVWVMQSLVMVAFWFGGIYARLPGVDYTQ
jgi:hypothetical protein